MEFLIAQINLIKKNYFIILIIILLIVINDAFILGDFYLLNSNKGIAINKSDSKVSLDTNTKKEIKVDIKGMVKKPGVYSVNENMNVQDVIDIAGGLKKNATTDNINLSKKIFDQMVIIVLSKSDLNKKVNNKTELKNDAIISNQISADISLYKSNSESNLTSKLININTASLDELMMITGVGKSKAEAIISYRETQSFKSIDDLKNVSGIGEALFEKIKDQVSV